MLIWGSVRLLLSLYGEVSGFAQSFSCPSQLLCWCCVVLSCRWGCDNFRNTSLLAHRTSKVGGVSLFSNIAFLFVYFLAYNKTAATVSIINEVIHIINILLLLHFKHKIASQHKFFPQSNFIHCFKHKELGFCLTLLDLGGGPKDPRLGRLLSALNFMF